MITAATYPDTSQGAASFLKDNMISHEFLSANPDPSIRFIWLVNVDMNGEEIKVVVHLPGSLLGGEFGDFEVVETS